MSNILSCEWLKLKRSRFAVIGFLGTLIVPLLVIISSIQKYLKNPNNSIDLFGLYDSAIMFSMLLFAPLVLSVLAVYIVNREYSERTLKTIFSVPVERNKFLKGKFLILFTIVILFMLLSWLNILILAIICNLFFSVKQITILSAVYFLIKMLFGGILLYMTLTPVIYVSICTKSFITPLITVIAVCLLNVILSGSPVAGFFPWTATYLLATGRNSNSGCPPLVSFLIIALICVVSIAASRRRFLREDIM